MAWSGVLRTSSSTNTLRRSESLYWSLQSYSQAYFSSNWNRYVVSASIILGSDWYGVASGSRRRSGIRRLLNDSNRIRESSKEDKIISHKRMLSSWTSTSGIPIQRGVNKDPSIDSINADTNINTTSALNANDPSAITVTTATINNPQITSKHDMKDISAALVDRSQNQSQSLDDLEMVQLWKRDLISTDSETQHRALQLKDKVYSHLLSSLRSDKVGDDLLERLFALFHVIPHSNLTAVDYKFRISLLTSSGEFDMVEVCLEEASNRLSKAEFLSVLENSINETISISSSLPSSFLHIFASTILKFEGTLELLSGRYHIERSILKKILTNYLSSSSTSSSIISILKSYLHQSPYFASMLLTSCIDLLGQPGSTFVPTVIDLWNLKLSLNLSSPIDLHRTMTALYHNHQYQYVLDLYDQHTSIHEPWQFDIVLLSLAKLKDWDRLQTVFESLFRHQSLPNIHHYGIVLQALSQLGKIDIVDTLFNSLLERSITPSIEILHGLMYSRLSLGETHGVEHYFNKIRDFGLTPNPRSYNILLRSYRDSHDTQKSLYLIGEMAKLNIPISKYAVTTLISTCTEKRDAETGEAIFDWALSYGIRPDTIMYNSLIACYMESNSVAKAEKIYQRMKNEQCSPPGIDTLTSLLIGYSRLAPKIVPNHAEKIEYLQNEMNEYSIKPDSKWLSALMNYYLTIKNFDKVESIFSNLGMEYHIDPTPYHYTILMESYIIQRKFDKAESLYQDMKSRNVTPTFNTQEKYLRLKTSNPDVKVRQEAAGFLQSYLSATDIIDLESKQLPRNVIPFSMVSKVAREFMKCGNYEAALEFIKPYAELDGYDPKEQFKVSAFLLELYGHAGYWSLVEKTWEIFVNQVRRTYVPVKISPPSLDENPTPTYKKMLPKRYQGVFWKAINSKLNQLQNFGQYSEMLEFIHWSRDQGFGITSQNMNTLVKGLLVDDDYLVKGFELTEKYLAPTTVAKLHAKGFKNNGPLKAIEYKNFNLSKSTFNSLARRFDQLIAITAYENQCSRIKAFQMVNENYPKLMKLFSWRQKK